MNTEIIELLLEYLGGGIQEDRKKELMAWVDKSESNRLFFEKIRSDRSFRSRFELRNRIDLDEAIRKFDRKIAGNSRKDFFRRYSVYAAVVILLLSVGGVFFRSYMISEQPAGFTAKNEIKPGEAKAFLILANGQEVKLQYQDSLFVDLGERGQIINKHERLIYKNENSSTWEQWNELRVPRGGEYEVVLSDGTIVRLNSASSLKYPVVFGKENRKVELTGEAYFRVSKDTVPFLVQVGDMTVKVYGTAFNINSHLDRRIQTALVEGKVGITVKGYTEEFLLTDSQLADFDIRTGTVNVQQTDVTPYYAWTKGLLIFNNAPLQQIMATLSLWYDMDVFYQNPGLRELHFTGCIKRYDRIETILKALSQSVGVNFNIKGKTLIISM